MWTLHSAARLTLLLPLTPDTLRGYVYRFWLLVWTANNLGVTLVNKACFSSVDFRYPYFLSAIHMVCNMAGASLLLYASSQRSGGVDTSSTNSASTSHSHTHPKPSSALWNWIILHVLGSETSIPRAVLDATGHRRMLVFSVIFSLNIAIGNVSLQHVSVNFNQVMRSLVPALTILLAVCYPLRQPVSWPKVRAVCPIVVGVAMSCFGDISYTATGFIVTVCCIVLAALKVVASGEMLTGALKLHPVDLLSHMAPLALVQCLVAAVLQGEVSLIAGRWSTELAPWVNPYPMAVVWGSGLLSFSLNICSLQANKVTSPLTLCIAANVKQVLMIAVSTLMFGTVITPLNGAGIVVVLIASAWYSYISLGEENAQKLRTQRMLKAAESDLDDNLDDLDVEAGSESDALLDTKKTVSMVHRK